MKKLLFLLFVLVTSLKVLAYEGETFESEGITYRIESEDQYAPDCSVVSASDGLSGHVSIPRAIAHNGRDYFVYWIGPEAFKNCEKITSISIPDEFEIHDPILGNIRYPGIIGIENQAFQGCSGLTEMRIPPSVIDFGNGVFLDCPNLTHIYFLASRSIEPDTFAGCANSLEHVQISDKAEFIGSAAFKDFIKLTSINLENVKYIDREAFSGCENLTSVIFSDSLTEIHSGAFSGCKNLMEILTASSDDPANFNLPVSLTLIGGGAFEECLQLKSIFIPKSVTKIEHDPFYGCSNLVEITVDPHNMAYASEDGVLFDKAFTKLISYPQNSYISDYRLPETVTEIPSYAFAECMNLTSVDIPGEVTTIQNFTFNHCENLTSVKLPESLTSIRFNAFEFCQSLASIRIPDSVTEIGSFAFYACRNLSLLHLPESLDKIGDTAFGNCYSLKSLEIPDGTRLLGRSAFVLCENLKTVILPASLEAGPNADLPYAPYNIGTFGGCFEIEDVYYKAEDPVELNKSLFSLPTYEKATLHVPAAAVEKAAVTLPWSQFKNIKIHDFSNAVNDVYVETDMVAPFEIYTVNGVRVAGGIDSLSTGIYIVRQGNTVKKIAVK